MVDKGPIDNVAQIFGNNFADKQKQGQIYIKMKRGVKTRLPRLT